MFKKDNYIVTLTGGPGFNCAKENYIFKQRANADNIQPELDLEHGRLNYGTVRFNNQDNWRYATLYEVDLYDAWQKPVHIEDPFPEKYNFQKVEEVDIIKIPAPEEVKIIHRLPRLA